MRALSRRSFINICAASPALGAWKRAAGDTHRGKDGSGNLFLVWNDIHDPENGESDEFTTIENIVEVTRELGIPNGRRLIGIGARSGTVDDTFGLPGEMGYSWTLGSPWDALISNPTDGPALSLGYQDPIPVTQVGVLDESTAHHFVLDGNEGAGQVLWTFHNDDTYRHLTRTGFHNAFSDVDGGLAETLFEASNRAKAEPIVWATNEWRRRLAAFMPNLTDDLLWSRFASSLHQGSLEGRWLPYLRKRGWAGAAVVLRGSMMNVGQFYFKEWNRQSPSEPSFRVGAGVHGRLRLQYGREMRPVMRPDVAEWSMVGFLFDTEGHPEIAQWRQVSDIFGQPFHIHGFRGDGRHGGHTLFSMLGTGRLHLSLYPLEFSAGQSAYLSNADLRVIPSSAEKTNDGVSVVIENPSRNFVRNVRVRLLKVRTRRHEDVTVPLLRPLQQMRVEFRGKIATDHAAKRKIVVDHPGNVVESKRERRDNVCFV